MRKQQTPNVPPRRQEQHGDLKPNAAKPLQSKSPKRRVKRKAKPIVPSDFGVEIGGAPSFSLPELIGHRIEEGITVVKREVLSDGKERITYRNVLP